MEISNTVNSGSTIESNTPQQNNKSISEAMSTILTYSKNIILGAGGYLIRSASYCVDNSKAVFNAIITFNSRINYLNSQSEAEINSRINYLNSQLEAEIKNATSFLGLNEDKCLSLIEQGADVNIKNNRGDTIFNLSITSILDFSKISIKQIFNLEAFKSLDLTSKNLQGKTIGVLALQYNEFEIFKMLVERITDSKELNNLLLWAAYFCDIEGVKLLIEKGADVNCCNEHGLTPLHRIIQSYSLNDAEAINKAEIIALLIQYGADVNARTKTGDTPLHYIAVCGNDKDAQELIKKGASMSHLNENNCTPLDVAINNLNTSVIEFFTKEDSNLEFLNPQKDQDTHVYNVFYLARLSQTAFEKILNKNFELMRAGNKVKFHYVVNLILMKYFIENNSIYSDETYKKTIITRLILILQKFNSISEFSEEDKKRSLMLANALVMQILDSQNGEDSIDYTQGYNSFFVQYCILLLLEIGVVPSEIKNDPSLIDTFKKYPMLSEFLSQQIKKEKINHEITESDEMYSTICDMEAKLKPMKLNNTLFVKLFKMLRENNLELHPDMSLDEVQRAMTQTLKPLGAMYPINGLTKKLMMLMGADFGLSENLKQSLLKV